MLQKEDSAIHDLIEEKVASPDGYAFSSSMCINPP